MLVMLGWIYQVKLLTELLDRYLDDQLASTCLALWKFIFCFIIQKVRVPQSICGVHWFREIKIYLPHTHKNWLTCCKKLCEILIEFSINSDSTSISIKISPNFYRAKTDCVCIESIVSPFNQKWLKFCLLSPYWLNSETNHKFPCVQ